MTQTTSTATNNSLWLQRSTNLPATTWERNVWLKINNLTSGDDYQNIISCNYAGPSSSVGYPQLYFDKASGAIRYGTFESALFSDDIELVPASAISGKPWVHVRMWWEGGTDPIKVQVAVQGGSTYSYQTGAGNYGPLTQTYFLRGGFGEQGYDFRWAGNIIWSGYLSSGEKTAQAASDTLISPAAATANGFYSGTTASTCEQDETANNYDLTKNGTGTSVSDVPYTSSQTVAPDYASTKPAAFEPTVALGTPGAITGDYASVRPTAFEPTVALGTPLALTADFVAVRPVAFEPTVATGTPLALTADIASPLPSAVEPAVALGTAGAVTPDAASPAPVAVEPAVALGSPGALTSDAASVTPSTPEPSVALGAAGAVSPDAASVAPATIEPSVSLGTPLSVAPDAGSVVPLAAEPIVQIGGGTVAPDVATAGPTAAEPTVSLGTPGALTADVASGAPATPEPAVALGTALQIAPDAASALPAGVEPTDVYSGAVTITPDAASTAPSTPEPDVEVNAIVLYPDFGAPRDSVPVPVVARGSALAIDVYAAVEQPLALVVDITTGLPLELAPDVGIAAPVVPLPGVEVSLAPPLTTAVVGSVKLRSQLPENRITVTARLRSST
jgi:hypothetical protein